MLSYSTDPFLPVFWFRRRWMRIYPVLFPSWARPTFARFPSSSPLLVFGLLCPSLDFPLVDFHQWMSEADQAARYRVICPQLWSPLTCSSLVSPSLSPCPFLSPPYPTANPNSTSWVLRRPPHPCPFWPFLSSLGDTLHESSTLYCEQYVDKLTAMIITRCGR